MQRAEQPGEPGHDISTLLRAWSDGDRSALEKLTPIVYDELHRLAGRYMRRERPGPVSYTHLDVYKRQS